MTDLRQAAQQALEALTCTGEHDDPGHRCGYCDDYVDRNSIVREALHAALAAPPAEPARAWADGYKQGVEDERTSEANIGIAGFGAKVEPARQNPYGAPAPQAEPCSHVLYRTNDADKPQVICDRNGEVVLAMCKRCRKAEAELDAAPQAEPDDVVRDAERYRCLRRGQKWSVVDGVGTYLRADTLDAAIDAAMKGEDHE